MRPRIGPGQLLLAIAWLLAVPRGVSGVEFAAPDEAERVCRNWLDERVHFAGAWAGVLQPAIAETHEIAHGDTLLAWCFRVHPVGYVVVPRLRALSPIKAWSDESDFEPSTGDELVAILREDLGRALRGWRSDPARRPALAARQAWDRLASAPPAHRAALARGAIPPPRDAGPLLTSLWHQRAPYNDLCPMGDGGRCLVGCVATAAAQILRYHGWPLFGTGEHSYDWDGDQSCQGNVGGGTLSTVYSDPYDWAQMPDACDGGCTPEQRAALAELNYEVGVAFEMNYGYCSSGSLVQYALQVYPGYFRYDPSIQLEHRHAYTADSWFALIAEQIDAGLPMQYLIFNHSCVCDGYRTQSGAHQVHINYGFEGGSHNGWYAVDNLYGSPYPEGEILIRNIMPCSTYLVRPDGTGDFPTLQAAFDALENGALILLADGIYRGAGNRDLDLHGKALRLQPQLGLAGGCILDCEGSVEAPHRAFRLHSREGPGTHIEGLVIVGGWAERGGAIHCENADPTFVRCTLAGNAATAAGGGLYCGQGAQPSLEQVIIAFSPAGEAVACDGGAAPQLSCCDLYDNAGGDWVGCVATQAGEDGNLSADPDFCDAPGGNYGLRAGSPCAPEANPACGLIGAWPVRCGSSSQYLIRADGSGDYPTIQAAIDAAFDGDTILLADGIFSGAGNVDLDYHGKAITVRSVSGNAEACVIHCVPEGGTETHRGFCFVSGEGPGSVLDGITIMNGEAPPSPYPHWYKGGAILCAGASPTIVRCRFLYNDAAGIQTWIGEGGALYITGAAVAISDCHFERNGSPRGGAVTCHSAASFTGCIFLRNVSASGGGAILATNASTLALDRCVFVDNQANHGGGVYAGADTLQVEGCTFTGNYGSTGGAVYCRDCQAWLTSCTLAANASGYTRPGSGLYGSDATVTVARTIIAFGTQGTGAYGQGESQASFSCCDIYGNVGGDWVNGIDGQLGVNGNISLDPLFCGEAYADDPYTLWDTSPCAPFSPQNPECDLVGACAVGCSVQAAEDPTSAVGGAMLRFASPAAEARVTLRLPPAAGGARSTLDVHDLAGRHIARLLDGRFPPGTRQVVWDGSTPDGRRASSGLYFLRLRAGETTLTRPFLRIRWGCSSGS